MYVFVVMPVILHWNDSKASAKGRGLGIQVNALFSFYWCSIVCSDSDRSISPSKGKNCKKTDVVGRELSIVLIYFPKMNGWVKQYE